MSEKSPPTLMGRLAVRLGMISLDQLSQATAEQGRSVHGARIGNILVDKGYITESQLARLEAVQRDVIVKHRARQATRATTHAAQRAPVPSAPSTSSTPSVRTRPGEGRDPTPARTAKPRQVARAGTAATPAPPARDPSPIATPAADEAEVVLTEVSETQPESHPIPAAAPAPAPAERPAASAPADAEDGERSLGLSLCESEHGDRAKLEALLAEAVKRGASDIHLHSGRPLALRVDGELGNRGETVLDRRQVECLLAAALDAEQHARLCRFGEIDFCLDVESVGRFRANAYRQQHGFDLVLRSIPAEPPSLDELGLPAALARHTNYHQGMVLVTGPAGCGKSSTLAALVNLINEERREHILTIEDPIEVVHPPKRCLVNQRHAGHHTQGFARALRAALREDPDVIVVGELRDLETISLAMTASETGHFVLATLHTNNAVRTINRMIGAFPSAEQAQARTMLSESLRAVVSQRLLPRADGKGRVAALEVLVIDKAVANLIREQKTIQIRSAIQTGRSRGMCLLEQSLDELVRAGTVTREAALAVAEEKKLVTSGA